MRALPVCNWSWILCGGLEESRSRFARWPHLSDDKTVAKMGHPNLDVGHPAKKTLVGDPVPSPERWPFSRPLLFCHSKHAAGEVPSETKSVPQGLKPHCNITLAARLKPCP